MGEGQLKKRKRIIYQSLILVILLPIFAGVSYTLADDTNNSSSSISQSTVESVTESSTSKDEPTDSSTETSSTEASSSSEPVSDSSEESSTSEKKATPQESTDEEALSNNIPLGFYASGKYEGVEPTVKNIEAIYEAQEEAENTNMNLVLSRSNRLTLLSSTAPDDLSSSDTSLPRKDFIDIASYQSWMTQADFNQLKKLGVKGVCIKLTEGTSYRNPYAKTQIAMAKTAGLVVSTYHYSRFSSTSSAQSEANYYTAYAKELGLSTSTLMVNDAEDPDMNPTKVDATITSLAFKNQLAANGYNNVVHYCSASWVGNTSYMEPQKLGAENFWVAQYLYGKPSSSNLLHTGSAAWQYSSQMYYSGLSKTAPIDTSIDYKGRFTPSTVAQPITDLKPSTSGQLQYRTHVSSIGWQSVINSPNTAGTTGKQLNMEAFQIAYSESGVSGNIVYSAYVQGVGWQSSVKNGAIAGTTGQNLRLEALKISLTGELKNKYHIVYRAYVQGVGWQDWQQDGAIAGTVGKAKRVEAIQAKLVPIEMTTVTEKFVDATTGAQISSAVKSTKEVGTTATFTPITIVGYNTPAVQKVTIQKNQVITHKYSAKQVTAILKYSTHVQNIGWQSDVTSPSTAGTTGRSLRLEALKIKISGDSGDIIYQAHVQSVGWQNEVNNGLIAGTTGRKKRVEAIKIRLTGQLQSKYHIYYRVHVQGIGWQGWQSDGAIAGTTGQARRLEAIEIKLVAK